MKKPISILLCLILILSLFAACASPAQEKQPEPRLRVVTTIFPIYDWLREILGARAADVDLCFLLDSGVDLHSFQPTADDMVRIAQCDLFVYVGGESDEWVEDAIAEATNRDLLAVSLLDLLGDAVREEERVEGMQDEDHDGEEEEHGHDEEPEYDEHVWLSLKNARAVCAALCDTLCTLDPDGDAVYRENTRSYLDKLSALDARYAEAVREARFDTLLFGDRFPFRYLADDYGLSYYAAFAGCSAETEASFETIVFLAGKIDELGLTSVLILESGDGKIARTIIENTADKNAQIRTLDSMQSTTLQDVHDGASYLSVMESDLAVLRGALN